MDFEGRLTEKLQRPEVCPIHNCGDCLCVARIRGQNTTQFSPRRSVRVYDPAAVHEKLEMIIAELTALRKTLDHLKK